MAKAAKTGDVTTIVNNLSAILEPLTADIEACETALDEARNKYETAKREIIKQLGIVSGPMPSGRIATRAPRGQAKAAVEALNDKAIVKAIGDKARLGDVIKSLGLDGSAKTHLKARLDTLVAAKELKYTSNGPQSFYSTK